MKIVLVFVFAFCFIQQGYAATKTWDGGAGTDNWTHAANWDSDVAPIGGDALVFDGSAQPTPNNDFPNATSFASITFAATASTFTLSGNSVIITGGATAITTNAASLTMTIGNNITFSTAAPTITIVSLGTLAISGTIVNGGLLITTTCDGTLTLSGVISGVGGFTKNGAGTCTLSETNTMSGTTTISAGTLEFGGNGNVAGAIVNNSALAFNQTGSITNSSLISGTGTIPLREYSP
jgi:autotransporter-associated beta strand protein